MSEQQSARDAAVRPRSSLYDNLGSALLALFLATVVWVVATYEADPPRTDSVSNIPIRIVNQPDTLQLMREFSDRLEVKARAPESSWNDLDVSGFDAYVDLQGLQEGTWDVAVQAAYPSDQAVTILERTPASIAIELEERTTRQLRVQARLLDTASVPLGYVLSGPDLSPETVSVSGPRTLVERVHEATVGIELDGSRESMSVSIAPALRDAQGNLVTGLTVAPPLVEATVQIERQHGYREVTVRAVTTGSPAPGYWVSNIAVEPLTVIVYGKPEIIEELPGLVETNPIDIEGVEGTTTKRVPLSLPAGVSVFSEDVSGQTVNVIVEVSPIIGGQTVRQTVAYQGLATGYRAVLSPEVVDVILSGPLPDLQELKPEDVQVALNLLGLGVGTHKLEPTVLLPGGSKLQVKIVQPETIEVTIDFVPTETPTVTPTPTPTATPSPAPQLTPTPAQTTLPTATAEPVRGP